MLLVCRTRMDHNLPSKMQAVARHQREAAKTWPMHMHISMNHAVIVKSKIRLRIQKCVCDYICFTFWWEHLDIHVPETES